MAWKKGPLPKKTYGWGGVIKDDQVNNAGFLFADFRGDHVVVGQMDTNKKYEKGDKDRIEAYDVAYYDNSIQLPVKDHLAKEES